MPSSLASALVRSARSIAGQNLTRLARSYAPKHLQAGIHSQVVEESEGVIRITLTSKGADARAQEYGSGLQDRRNPHKYPIPKVPKTPPQFLEFQGTNAYEGWLIRTRQVQHPGIHPVTNNGQEGYIRPALKQFREHLKTGDFPEEIKRAIVSDIRRSFGGK
jgi:hypothetical protein